VGRARLANMAGRPVEYVSSWAGMEQRLLGLHRGHSALGDGDREALEVYGRKALSGDDLELFGRKPMEQQLLVWIPRLPRARAMAGKGRGGGHRVLDAAKFARYCTGFDLPAVCPSHPVLDVCRAPGVLFGEAGHAAAGGRRHRPCEAAHCGGWLRERPRHAGVQAAGDRGSSCAALRTHPGY
jgi:hypothetical protein